MKLLSLILLSFVSLCSFAQQKPDENCEVKGIKLMGEVQVVESLADLNVYVSEYTGSWSFEVKITDGYPTSCCEWRINDEYMSDFTIKLVKYESSADIVITLKDNEASRAFIEKYNLDDNW
jgi:hypothetical protein